MSCKILQFVLILDAKKCWTVFVYMECEFRLSIPEHIDAFIFVLVCLNEARKRRRRIVVW